MKLLMLTHRFPYPPDRGDRIRAWGELEFLAQRHDLWLACVDRVAPSPTHLDCVSRLCRDVAVFVRSGASSLVRGGLSLVRGTSLTEGYFGETRLARTLQHWSATIGFDAVLTFSSAMAPYAQLVTARRRVLDMNDVDSRKWRIYARRSWPPLSWLYALESRRLATAETRCVRTHDICLLVNERERGKLHDCADPSRTAVVRTGVDLSRYADIGTLPQSVALPAGCGVGTVGSMSYAPNVRAVNWFGRHVWPAVKRAMPQARWLIVGSRPKRSVRRWGCLPDVKVTGFVSDVRPWLNAMRVFICACHDDIGVQTKLIEAMAAGKAAVVTPESAAGIDYAGEPPFLIAESPRQFADSVLHLLADDSLARQLGARARALAESKYGVNDQVRLVERWLLAGLGSDGLSVRQSPAPTLPDGRELVTA